MSSVMEQLQEQRRRFHEQGGGQPAATQPSGATASPTMDKLKAQRQEFLAKKAQEEQAQAQEAQAQAQWEQEQNEGSSVEKYGGQALRGMFRGGEKLMVAAADLVGADEFAENYESKAGRSSGSILERGSEYATPIPGLGVVGRVLAKLPKLGKAIQASTMGGAAARSAGQAGTYGLVTSDADTAVGKVIDAGQAAATGALLGGVGHSVIGGLGKVSEAAKKSMARVAELGDSKISEGVPTLAKRADSDIGGKLAKTLAKTVNRGKRAHTARDRDQRYLDDIYQGEVRETYKGIPGAVEAATKELNKSRNYRTATKVGEKAANKYFKNSALLQTEKQADARALLTKTVNMTKKNKDKIGAGRFTKTHAEEAGNTQLAEKMAIMPNMGFTPVKKPDAYKPASLGELAAEGGAIFSGVPSLQAAGAYGAGSRGLSKARNMLQKHAVKRADVDKGKFRARVGDLPELPANPKVAEFLLGNTEAQKKYQELVASGNAKAVEDFVKRLSMRVAGNQDDAP